MAMKPLHADGERYLAYMQQYRTIIADPPWKYSNAGVRGNAENQYSTMGIDDICGLPISEIVADDAVLFLWATWPLLCEAHRVIDAWGFTYKTGFPWVKLVGDPAPTLFGSWDIKPQYGTGFWIRGCSEPLLICTRGNASPLSGEFVGLLSQNFQHSRKPENLYELAEKYDGPYLELFARRPRAGWDVFGNEVDGITLQREHETPLLDAPGAQRERDEG